MTSEYYKKYWKDGVAQWVPRGLDVLPAEAALVGCHVRPGVSALDVGCGDGRMARLLLRLGASYTGLDVSETAVKICSGQGLMAFQQDMNDPLPLEANSFDVVTIFEVLEHIFSPDMAFQEIVRVLRPGGVAVGSVPNIAYFPNRLLMLMGQFCPGGAPSTSLKKPWLDPHIRFFTFSSMRRFLESGSPVTIETLVGAPFDLSDVPVLCRLSPAVKRRIQAGGRLIGFMGTLFPRLFSARIYFVVRKAPGFAVAA